MAMNSERAALLCMLLCAALFIAHGASASSFLPHDAGAIAASATAATSTLHPRRQLLKGKIIARFGAVLRPTWHQGKVIGDKGASGRVVVKAVRYSEARYTVFLKIFIFAIKSRGKNPMTTPASTCTSGTPSYMNIPEDKWLNITTRRGGSNKRYSFKMAATSPTTVESAAIEDARLITGGGKYFLVGHEGKKYALCGKYVRRK
ncbi:unnamed protein product [Closterium sp. NIES-65]|nr:unnamed protein product [Closterium sp. NIES-65]